MSLIKVGCHGDYSKLGTATTRAGARSASTHMKVPEGLITLEVGTIEKTKELIFTLSIKEAHTMKSLGYWIGGFNALVELINQGRNYDE